MRRITKIRRSIRAISPVISVLLMIAIAVVASLVAYAWVMGYMGFQTGKIGKAVTIQSSAFNTEGTQLTVYVQNVGQGTEQLNHPSNTVYVNDVPYDILVVYPSGMLADYKITVPEGQTVGLTIDYLYVAGQELRIKIVTSDGTIAQQTTTGTEGGPSPTSSAPPGNVAPSAGFTFSATNLVVQFTDASTDSDGTIASRLWAFGDTQTSTETNPSHTYAAAGTYTVRLTVTDDDGATNYVEHDVQVAPGNAAPTAAFTFAPANPTTADTVTFTDGSSDSDGTIASRAWTFGDGQTSTATNPTHQYTTANTYTVRLTVTDDDGATNYVEHNVVVTAAPTPQTITRSPTSDSGSGGGWSNRGDAYADGGNSASSNDNNEYCIFSGYGFTVPSGATVTQVRVRLDAWASNGNDNDRDDIRLEVYDGSWHTYIPNPVTLSGSEATIWCDVTSLSSGGWNPTEVNGIQVRVTHIQDGWSDSDIYLDCIPIEVTYTP